MDAPAALDQSAGAEPAKGTADSLAVDDSFVMDDDPAHSEKLDVVQGKLASVAPYLVCFIVVLLSALALFNS